MWWMAALALGAPPEMGEGSVFSPEVKVGDAAFERGGTAFVVLHEGKPVFLTALHLAGPALGFERQFTADEVPYTVELRVRDWQTFALADRTAEGRRLVGTHNDTSKRVFWDDLMAFDLSAKARKGKRPIPVTPLPLADRCPAVGEPVYLFGPTKVQAGTVAQCRPWSLEIEVTGFELRSTSGAPWLDAEGRVVGMNVRASGDGTLAIAIPGLSIVDRLDGEVPALPMATERLRWPAIDNPWHLDLEGLHESRLPRWGLTGENEQVIREGLALVPEIDQLFVGISKLAWEDSRGNLSDIVALGRKWDALYAEHGIPYRHSFAAGGSNTLAWMTHVRLGTVSEGDREAMLAVRVDRLNIHERPVYWYDDGRITLHPRGVRDEMVTRVMPRVTDPALRQELAAVLAPEALAVLERAAPLRAEIEAVRKAVRKRSRCSRVAIRMLPWNGLPTDLNQQLAERVGTGRCAGILQSELDRLRTATRDLQALDGLERALRALLVHTMRPFAITALTEGASEDPTEAWRRALVDPTSGQTARSLVCFVEGKRPSGCARSTGGVKPALKGLPTTLPLTWAEI